MILIGRKCREWFNPFRCVMPTCPSRVFLYLVDQRLAEYTG